MLKKKNIFKLWHVLSGKTARAVFLYRLSNWCYNNRLRLLSHLFWRLNVTFHSIEIAPTANIGKGFRIAHSVGIVIGAGTTIGENLNIYQNVTIGSKLDKDGKAQYPIIGNNVTLYPGSVIVGKITIGDEAVVAPNSVVIKDVPSKTIAMGIPAKIKIYNSDSY